MIDPNASAYGTSIYEIKHNYKLNLDFKKAFFAGYETRMSLFGELRSGTPYNLGMSTTTTGGRSALFGTIQSTTTTDRRYMLYVPNVSSQTADPLVSYASTAVYEGLRDYVVAMGLKQGAIVGKNSERSPDFFKAGSAPGAGGSILRRIPDQGVRRRGEPAEPAQRQVGLVPLLRSAAGSGGCELRRALGLVLHAVPVQPASPSLRCAPTGGWACGTCAWASGSSSEGVTIRRLLPLTLFLLCGVARALEGPATPAHYQAEETIVVLGARAAGDSALRGGDGQSATEAAVGASRTGKGGSPASMSWSPSPASARPRPQ